MTTEIKEISRKEIIRLRVMGLTVKQMSEKLGVEVIWINNALNKMQKEGLIKLGGRSKIKLVD